jgi:hypothetical protein
MIDELPDLLLPLWFDFDTDIRPNIDEADQFTTITLWQASCRYEEWDLRTSAHLISWPEQSSSNIYRRIGLLTMRNWYEGDGGKIDKYGMRFKSIAQSTELPKSDWFKEILIV